MKCFVCRQSMSQATRVVLHPTYLGIRHAFPYCMPSDGCSPIGFVPNLWVFCHEPCHFSVCSNMHKVCEVCGFSLDEVPDLIRWQTTGERIKGFHLGENTMFARDARMYDRPKILGLDPFTVSESVKR
ncbi:uncharacterized protein LOC116417054 [Nasonia vitripennis]|uniref:Uncharacterized protein n=1 Tax=Nasonia vitripennis TaxID=7425 RepID=A0A7M7Q9A3_NASVI|nr:uncharacterized protein LOC116417054 [Nasonia vitripennis]